MVAVSYLSVKCVSSKSYPLRLTVGKTYKIRKRTPAGYIITDDKGSTQWFGKTQFTLKGDCI